MSQYFRATIAQAASCRACHSGGDSFSLLLLMAMLLLLAARGARGRSKRIASAVARMSVSEIRDRHSSFKIAPGFHGACHRAGHFGPDPLVHPGYKLRRGGRRSAER